MLASNRKTWLFPDYASRCARQESLNFTVHISTEMAYLRFRDLVLKQAFLTEGYPYILNPWIAHIKPKVSGKRFEKLKSSELRVISHNLRILIFRTEIKCWSWSLGAYILSPWSLNLKTVSREHQRRVDGCRRYRNIDKGRFQHRTCFDISPTNDIY